MVACGVSLLILDEPTNHLDIDSRETLENALLDFDGTIITVSHDRYFIKNLATAILEIDKNGYDAGYVYKRCRYEEFLDKHIKNEAVSEKAESGAGKFSYEEAKQRKNQYRSAKNKYAATEAEIEKAENELSALRARENDESITSDYVALNELFESISKTENKINSLYEELERLEEIILTYEE